MAPVAVQNTANGGLPQDYPSGVDGVVHKTHMPVGLEKAVPNPGKTLLIKRFSGTYNGYGRIKRRLACTEIGLRFLQASREQIQRQVQKTRSLPPPGSRR